MSHNVVKVIMNGLFKSHGICSSIRSCLGSLISPMKISPQLLCLHCNEHLVLRSLKLFQASTIIGHNFMTLHLVVFEVHIVHMV
jgi:hypothetical protein